MQKNDSYNIWLLYFFLEYYCYKRMTFANKMDRWPDLIKTADSRWMQTSSNQGNWVLGEAYDNDSDYSSELNICNREIIK